MSLFSKIVREPYRTDNIRNVDVESFYIAGTDYRTSNIRSAGNENPCYSMSKKQLVDELMVEENIYKYDFDNLPVSLAFEPENKSDPNAIKVIVNDQHVGYIPRNLTKHVRRVMKSDLDSLSVDIYGGPCKRICDNGDGTYDTDKWSDDYQVVLHIYRKRS